jgi:hypothetical protein
MLLVVVLLLSDVVAVGRYSGGESSSWRPSFSIR